MKIFYTYGEEADEIRMVVDKDTAEKVKELLITQLTRQINTPKADFNEHFKELESTMHSLREVTKSLAKTEEIAKEVANG